MYEMKSLENEWKSYKKKRRRPYLLFILMISLIIATGISLDKEQISFESMREKIQDFIDLNTKSIAVEKDHLEKSLIRSTGIKSLDREEKSLEVSESSEILVDIPILDMENNRILERQINTIEPKNTPLIEIVGTSSVIAYEEVEARFEQHHDIDDALFLAKSYYKKGDYEKAAYWALETNKLDDDIEESIFIFVEAKVKSGQINEGILILKRYIQQSSSDEAKKLLFRIENN